MGEATHGNDNNNFFASLQIWRNKVGSDLREPPHLQSPDFKMRLLLEHGKGCEQAVWGCLKDALSELHEGQEWGLLGADFAAAQHRRLYNLAAQELLNAKALVLGLAHEHGVTAAYSAALRRPLQHTVADYERVGELRFALLVWRANLQRDLSVASGPADAEARVKEGYIAAVDLVHRCVDNSAEFWAAQQAGGAPGEAERRAVRAAALAKAQRSLLDIAEQHHVSKAAVQALL